MKNKKKSFPKTPKKWTMPVLRTLLALNLVILVLIVIFDVHVPMNTTIADIKTTSSSLAPSSQETISEVPVSIPVLDNHETLTLPFTTYAESVYVYDLDGENALYSKNPEVVRAPASLTKVMTAIIAIENTPDLENTMLTYSESMKEELLNYGLAESDIATFDFYKGEQIRMIDALYILMLRSSNDAANLIAENVAGSTANFVELMNKKAAEIGANTTHFMNPHGLDAENHYSTAYDLFLITQYAQTLPIFNTISSSSFYTIPATNSRKSIEIETYVSLYDPTYAKAAFYYPYAQGIKTGYTDDAGKCLISYAEKDGHRLLLVLMGVPEKSADGEVLGYNQFFLEGKAFFEWGFAFLESPSSDSPTE